MEPASSAGELDHPSTPPSPPWRLSAAILGDDVVDAGLRPLMERIAQLQSPVAEERKLVTTLFADLVGFTAMSERLDPEVVRTVVDRYFAALDDRHRGTRRSRREVHRRCGDGGVWIRQAQRTTRSGGSRIPRHGGLLDDLNDGLADEGWPVLEMRVGINTGEVVIGAVGDRPHEEWMAVGDPINVASRLQAEAPVNGILISHSTFRHVRGRLRRPRGGAADPEGEKGACPPPMWWNGRNPGLSA